MSKGQKSPWSLVRLHSFIVQPEPAFVETECGPGENADFVHGHTRGARPGIEGNKWGREDVWVGWNQIRNNFPHV